MSSESETKNGRLINESFKGLINVGTSVFSVNLWLTFM